MEIRRAKKKRKQKETTKNKQEKIHYKNSHLNYHHNRTECVREREEGSDCTKYAREM